MNTRAKGGPVSGEKLDQPSAKAMQWVKNRNNIIDMYLKKQIDQFEREKDLHISLIDQDRLDIHDFLKQLKKCESDNLPEARQATAVKTVRVYVGKQAMKEYNPPLTDINWLGDRTPSGRRVPRTPRQIVIAPPPPKPEEPDIRDARTAPDRRNDKERDELGKFDFQFRSRPQPELVQRTQTLCNIFNRRNVLAGMHQKAWEEDTESRDGDSDPHASVTFKPASGASSRGGTESAFDFVRGAEGARGMDPADYCRTVSADGVPKTGDFMKDLLVCKYRKKKRKKKPLDDRIQDFFQTCENLKSETNAAAVNPPDAEVARKWTLLTKGVKAALAESSDEEDDNNMHTL